MTAPICMAKKLTRFNYNHNQILRSTLVVDLFYLWHNMNMYLSESEQKTITNAYGYDGLIDDGHYQVGPDAWVYLFHDSDDKKYVLIVADYLDYDYDHFPHLLRFSDSQFHKIEFVLQQEIRPVDPEKASNSQLFEYS